jgi:hypothetical protein
VLPQTKHRLASSLTRVPQVGQIFLFSFAIRPLFGFNSSYLPAAIIPEPIRKDSPGGAATFLEK